MNFIEEIIEKDLLEKKNDARVHTRFPPEPNGFLHIGHAKSICLNFGLAEKYNGKCNLRFDDTNPIKEEQKYIDAIKEDIQWLGFKWDGEYYASDYFTQLYEWAEKLIMMGLAYVDEQTQEEISKNRGVPTKPGIESPYRNRTKEENLALFRRMKAGEFADGSKVLRAKIDMASPNMHLRDPIMYRILHAEHHRTGNQWVIYPMYDYAHGQSDSIEGITHSLCTLEFEVHRPLYDWFCKALDIHHPQQIEFARLNLNYTVMSKRKLLQLVERGFVNGWDDPRMPTISGLRRRGYTPQSIRNFADIVGIAKRDNLIDINLLEFCAREDLNKEAQRVMTVIDPVKLIIDNYPENQTEILQATNNPEKPETGTRDIPFSRELWIERADFKEEADKKFYRLTIGREVRLKYAYIITCTHVVKDANGEIIEIHADYFPETKSGRAESNRKVKATIHWLSVAHTKKAEIRLFDKLFAVPEPEQLANEEEKEFTDYVNPNSLIVKEGFIEESLQLENAAKNYQFERIGYFCIDPDSSENQIIFNKTVNLKQ
ncbi:MAG TPA: glutamine--tRNA ligase/YqeY domain fusion protein [Bacteroidales bacterium]|nr:glutamine--tRNA ligase/YqeY domain fusion protein [Bacteroidales bacterium]HOS58095.1 glutamine--tRNA ligase/YqeY domain fusion protein [Bacteroidales bacterium]